MKKFSFNPFKKVNKMSYIISVHVSDTCYRDEHTYLLFTTSVKEKAVEAQTYLIKWIKGYQDVQIGKECSADEVVLAGLRIGLMTVFPIIKEKVIISMMGDDWARHVVNIDLVEEWNG